MEERSRIEIIIKTLAIHIAVIASAGHITSLQRQSQKSIKSTLWQLAWFIAVPKYPIAIFVNHIVEIAIIVRQKGFQVVHLPYYIAGVLGVHAQLKSEVFEEVSESIALFDVSPEDVRRVSLKRDCIWAGRLLLLLTVLTQSSATLLLCIRRLRASQMSEIDIRNGSVACGGVVIQFLSILILLRNERWEVTATASSRVSHSIQTSRSPNPTILTKLLVTTSLLLSCWYFRFHIQDTFHIASHSRNTVMHNFYMDLNTHQDDLNISNSMKHGIRDSHAHPSHPSGTPGFTYYPDRLNISNRTSPYIRTGDEPALLINFV